MTKALEHDAPELEITAAFEELRREMSLTRHAVEGLTSARERIPNYDATLATMAEALAGIAERLDAVQQSPAMKLTPLGLVQDVVNASVAVRTEDARLIQSGRDAIIGAVGRIDGIVERGQAASGRKRERSMWCAGGAAAAVLVWSVLPGAVARAPRELARGGMDGGTDDEPRQGASWETTDESSCSTGPIRGPMSALCGRSRRAARMAGTGRKQTGSSRSQETTRGRVKRMTQSQSKDDEAACFAQYTRCR